jgi:hypothetical protein
MKPTYEVAAVVLWNSEVEKNESLKDPGFAASPGLLFNKYLKMYSISESSLGTYIRH